MQVAIKEIGIAASNRGGKLDFHHPWPGFLSSRHIWTASTGTAAPSQYVELQTAAAAAAALSEQTLQPVRLVRHLISIGICAESLRRLSAGFDSKPERTVISSHLGKDEPTAYVKYQKNGQRTALHEALLKDVDDLDELRNVRPVFLASDQQSSRRTAMEMGVKLSVHAAYLLKPKGPWSRTKKGPPRQRPPQQLAAPRGLSLPVNNGHVQESAT